MSNNQIKLEAINITKNFGNTVAVKNLNLKIYSGEIFAFLGPNGAGKTTTVKIFSGLLKPTTGSAFVCGFDISKNHIEVKSRIGLVPDHPFLYPKLTGIEFLQFVETIYKVKNSKVEKTDAIYGEKETPKPLKLISSLFQGGLKEQGKEKPILNELMKLFDLQDAANDLIETYSLGMRQKLTIASVLLHNPEVLFLDEPLVGLDPKTARIVKNIFTELSHQGKTIFMCTHILEIAEKLADKIGIINRGELVAVGTKEELCILASGGHAYSGTLEDIYLSITK